MSTCPEVDLLSVYLDGELNEPFRSALEKHLSECAPCRQNYLALENIHKRLQEDAAGMNFSEEETAADFENLCAQRKYNSVKKLTQPRNSMRFIRIVSAAAAACLLAVFIPVHTHKKSTVSPAENFTHVPTIAQMINNTGIKADKNLDAYRNTSVFPVSFTNQQFAPADIFRPELPANTIRLNVKLTDISGLQGSYVRTNIPAPTIIVQKE